MPILLLRLQENDLPLRSGGSQAQGCIQESACRADHLSASGSMSETT